ncbi:MAG TPA: phage portal protein, partial [Thermomicrobiales bacterium]|nr:phage portal protein [Thermomicrobiales bacterium]
MKTLIPARSTKAIDQQAMAGIDNVTYLPLENLRTWTGLGVSPETAMNMVTVYQCVRVLANAYAQIPLLFYRRLGDSRKERATDHPLYETFHLRPNPDMTSFAWRRLMMTHLATWGNAYCEVTRDLLGRIQLWPIRPDRIEPKFDSDGRKVYDYLSPLGERKPLEPGRIFHIAGLSRDGLKGVSPITELRSTIGLGKTAERFGESFFRNNARPATVLQHPMTLSEGAVTRLAAQMEDLKGSANAGKTVVLEEGTTIQEIGIPPDDAQFMETRLFQKRELAGAYGIQPHKIGDLERATFSNIEQQSLEFIQDTMMPWFVLTEQEIAAQLLPDGDNSYFAEFLIDGYLRADAKTRAESFAIRWQHGALSADEWRAKENENPIEGGIGERFYVPVNYVAVEADDPVAQPAAEPQQPPQLSVVKSAAVRCDKGHLLAELATPPYRFTCSKCKSVVST